MISNTTASSILLALFLGCPPALAESNFTLDPESSRIHELPEPVVKTVATVPLPPWPRDTDLIAFTPDGPPTPFRFYIDGKNLSTDARHEEVHYTLILESKSGIRNISFEGIRCTLRGEYKTFAYGTNGHFARAPGDEWRNRFCIARETRGRALPDILRALKGRVSATDSTGFQAQ